GIGPPRFFCCTRQGLLLSPFQREVPRFVFRPFDCVYGNHRICLGLGTIMQAAKIPFISYAHEDAETAKRLYDDLTLAGANPWLDVEKLIGGEDWEAAIRKAIRE